MAIFQVVKMCLECLRKEIGAMMGRKRGGGGSSQMWDPSPIIYLFNYGILWYLVEKPNNVNWTISQRIEYTKTTSPTQPSLPRK